MIYIYTYIKYIYSENDVTISRGILPCLNSRPTECLTSASRVESTAKKTFGIMCQFQILKPTIPNKYVYLRFRRKKSFKKCQFQFHCFYQSNWRLTVRAEENFQVPNWFVICLRNLREQKACHRQKKVVSKTMNFRIGNWTGKDTVCAGVCKMTHNALASLNNHPTRVANSVDTHLQNQRRHILKNMTSKTISICRCCL